MSNLEKRIRSIIRDNELKAKRKKRKCFIPDCDENSISSHLLQKNGMLSRLTTDDNHLFQFGIDTFKPQLFFFEKIGANEALTFPGFCNKHDTILFKDIEKPIIDFKNYRTNLLFSYRILANELRKKEILIDSFTANIENATLQTYLNNGYFISLSQSINGYRQAIKDCNYYLDYFYSDIFSDTQNFNFFTIELPFVEFCASGVFTLETTEEMRQIPDWEWDKPLTDIYFNLLPLQNKSIVIFGYLNEMKEKCSEFIRSFENLDNTIALKKISDLLLRRIENWLCSQSARNKLDKKENDITKIIHQTIRISDENMPVNLNLFENMLKE